MVTPKNNEIGCFLGSFYLLGYWLAVFLLVKLFGVVINFFGEILFGQTSSFWIYLVGLFPSIILVTLLQEKLKDISPSNSIFLVRTILLASLIHIILFSHLMMMQNIGWTEFIVVLVIYLVFFFANCTYVFIPLNLLFILLSLKYGVLNAQSIIIFVYAIFFMIALSYDSIISFRINNIKKITGKTLVEWRNILELEKRIEEENNKTPLELNLGVSIFSILAQKAMHISVPGLGFLINPIIKALISGPRKIYRDTRLTNEIRESIALIEKSEDNLATVYKFLEFGLIGLTIIYIFFPAKIYIHNDITYLFSFIYSSIKSLFYL